MEEVLEWIPGGAAGAMIVASVVAFGTYYVATRPKSSRPMVPLDEQSFPEPVSTKSLFKFFSSSFCLSSNFLSKGEQKQANKAWDGMAFQAHVLSLLPMLHS